MSQSKLMTIVHEYSSNVPMFMICNKHGLNSAEVINIIHKVRVGK